MPLSGHSSAIFEAVFPARARRRLGRAFLSLWNCLFGIAFMMLLPAAILFFLLVVFVLASLFRPAG